MSPRPADGDDGAMRVYQQHPARAAGIAVAVGLLVIGALLRASREPGWMAYVAAFVFVIGFAVVLIAGFAKLMVGPDVVIVRDDFVSHYFQRGHATASVRETRRVHGLSIHRSRSLTLTNSTDGRSRTFNIGSLPRALQRTLLADVEAALGQPIEGREFIDV